MDEDKLVIEEVVSIVDQMERDGRKRRELYQKIDDAVGCVFTPDPAVSQLPYIQGRHFASTEIADARNTGVRTFSSLLPDIHIQPVQDNEGEYDRVDKMEQAWLWEMQRMNRPVNGQKGIHDKIVESAITYHAVALQTEYLPYKLKGKDDRRIKGILNRKNFNWTIHHPGSVEARYSDFGLERVAKKGDFTALQLIENFGKDNPGIQKMMEELRDKKKSDLMTMKFTLHDYTDWDYRVQYISAQGSNAAKYELMNEKHDLPFIPWVVVDYGDTLWQAVLESGMWDNVQHMELMRFARAVAMGMRSDLVIKTPDGKLTNVWMEYQNPLNPTVIPDGVEVKELRSNNIDPAFETQLESMKANVAKSTVARVLQDLTPYMSSPFSSMNAAITMALGQLSSAKKVGEAAEAEAIYQGFQWIKHSKIPFYSFRDKNGDGKLGQPYMAGEHIIITHEEPPTEEDWLLMSPMEAEMMQKQIYFDLSHLYVDVEFKSSNVTDEQAKMNLLINAKREFGMSSKEAFERMGWNNYQQNQDQRAIETLFDAELKKYVDMKMLEVQAQQMQMQAEQQMQMKMAQQNQINEMNAGSQFAGMEGADMRGGSLPAAGQAPNETRETITGRTRAGDAVI